MDVRGVHFAEGVDVFIAEFNCHLLAVLCKEAEGFGHLQECVLLHLQVRHWFADTINLDTPASGQHSERA
jgi:hypothetical protein